MDFRDHSISELVKKVKNKEISAKELTESALNNIEKYERIIAHIFTFHRLTGFSCNPATKLTTVSLVLFTITAHFGSKTCFLR